MKKIFFFLMMFSVSPVFAETAKENQGIVYILTNQAMNIDGIPVIKIGSTEKNLKDRINQLSSKTEVPVKFEEYYSIKINNYKKSKHISIMFLKNIGLIKIVNFSR